MCSLKWCSNLLFTSPSGLGPVPRAGKRTVRTRTQAIFVNPIERFIILILLELFIPFFCILWCAFQFACSLFQMVGKFVKTFQNRPKKELADATNLPAPFWCFKVMSTYASVFPIPYERRYTGFLIKKELADL